MSTMAEPGGICYVCLRDPGQVNSEHSECSLVDCPHRRRQWSDRVFPPARRFERAEDDTLGDLFDPRETG